MAYEVFRVEITRDENVTVGGVTVEIRSSNGDVAYLDR